MTRLVFRRAGLGQLRAADLELSAGRYVLLSTEAEAMASVIALACGREAPRSGYVTLDGEAPASSPELRRKIGALFVQESLPPARTVVESVALALSARRAREGLARSLLEDFGLGGFAAASPQSLAERELRSVALALALAHDTATLLALEEPLTTLLPKALILSALDRHNARGALVLTATTSSADAALLGGTWLCVELGSLKPAPATTPRLGSGAWQQLLVEASDPRALSLALQGSGRELLTEVGSTPFALKVTGPALELTAREVIAHARQHGIEISRMEASVPPVEALLAARAGFARGSYEAARNAALEAARPPSPAVRPEGSI